MLFLMVIDSLNRKVRDAKAMEILGIKVSKRITISYLMFVDDLLFGGRANLAEWTVIHCIISSVGRDSRLCMNGLKSLLIHNGNIGPVKEDIRFHLGVGLRHLDEGCTYLGFILKPKNYCIKDWEPLVNRFQKKLDG